MMMMASLLQVTEAVAEQEVRSDQGQNGAPRCPSQAVCLIHTNALGPQCEQGGGAALPASTCRHQVHAQRAVEHAEPLPHLTQLSRETLQRKKVNDPFIKTSFGSLYDFKSVQEKIPSFRRMLPGAPGGPVGSLASGWCWNGWRRLRRIKLWAALMDRSPSSGPAVQREHLVNDKEDGSQFWAFRVKLHMWLQVTINFTYDNWNIITATGTSTFG